MTLQDVVEMGPTILIIGGLAVTFFAALAAIAWLCGFMVRARQFALHWRLQSLKESHAAQTIRLDMATRERTHKLSASTDSGNTLRADLTAATREVTDVRNLLRAQEEVLAARQTDITAHTHRLVEQERLLQETLAEKTEAEQARDAAITDGNATRHQLETASASLSDRETLIRVLEGQVTTHKRSAEMANASAMDLQRELKGIRLEVENLKEKNGMLSQIANHQAKG